MPTFITMQPTSTQTVKKEYKPSTSTTNSSQGKKPKASWPAFKKSSLAGWKERNLVDMETYNFNIYL